jgi:hydroxymethylpyrimidine/phosphomethylpyrimidine kinase
MKLPVARVSVLSIAGSDSGGGAGIQADLKTFAAHRVHGLTAIAALTAQNTRGVRAQCVPDVAFLAAQVEALFDDFEITAVKLGMLASAAVIEAVASLLRRFKPVHVILDPVMVASSGARLLEPDALSALRTQLVPLATLLTPNVPEAELLLERRIGDSAAADDALHALCDLGARAVLLKGGHMPGAGPMEDLLLADGACTRFLHPRLDRSGHGTGCTLAAALAARLGRGEELLAACQGATDYVHGALAHAYAPGTGDVQVLDHFWHMEG